MGRNLVGLQTIQTGASKQGDQVIKYQLGSHLIRRGSQEESDEVEKKRQAKVGRNLENGEGEMFGGNTMSIMAAGVMDACIPLSDFLESLWIQNALVAYRAELPDHEDEVFSGAYEISTPKPNAPAINLLLYYLKSEQQKIDQLSAAVEARILPGMDGMAEEGLAMAGQVLPNEKVKRRVTSDRDYLYGKNDYWGAYAVKVRFPGNGKFRGYEDGGACLGIHLDDVSSISFERMVKLVTALRTIGMHEVERDQLRGKVVENQKRLRSYMEELTDPADRILLDITTDVYDALHIQTIYDRKLARSRDFWKKVKGR